MTDGETRVTGDGAAERDGPLAVLDARVARMREDDTRRRVALAVAVIVGLGLATIHWLGLVAAGALVGITRRTVPRALLAGLAFGVLVLLVFFVTTPWVSPGDLFALSPLSYLTVGLALVAPVWGALLRAAL